MALYHHLAFPASRPETGQALHGLGAARAHQPGNTQYFAASQRKETLSTRRK